MSKTIFTFTEEFDDAGHLIKRTITTEQGETILPVTPNTKPIDNMPLVPPPTSWKTPTKSIPSDPTCSKSTIALYNHSGGTAHES